MTTQPFTAKQREMLRCVSLGRSNAELAKDFGISVKTVEAARATIFKKLGAWNTAHAIRRGFELGLLVPEPEAVRRMTGPEAAAE